MPPSPHPPFVIRERVYAPGMRMARHAHDFSNVTVIVGGEIEESTEAGRYRGRSCSVLLKPAGCEHEDRVSGIGARTLTIELTGGSVADAVSRRRWSWHEQPEVVRGALALWRATRDDREAAAWSLLALVTAASRAYGTPPSWIAEVLAAIESRFDEPLRLDALARDFGFHPVYFSRAFHRHVGTPLHDYVRTLRLRHARHLLATTRKSVIAIAGASGFYDASHFSRTFSGALGVTPNAYRHLVAQVQRVQTAAPIPT